MRKWAETRTRCAGARRYRAEKTEFSSIFKNSRESGTVRTGPVSGKYGDFWSCLSTLRQYSVKYRSEGSTITYPRRNPCSLRFSQGSKIRADPLGIGGDAFLSILNRLARITDARSHMTKFLHGESLCVSWDGLKLVSFVSSSTDPHSYSHLLDLRRDSHTDGDSRTAPPSPATWCFPPPPANTFPQWNRG